MSFSGQITALEPRDIKRYPVDVASVPNRGAAATDGDRALSFPEVALKVSESSAPDLHAPPEIAHQAQAPKRNALWEQEEFGFRDFIDIINPLHHIPIVATLYRNMTGDKIGMVPRILGGGLWGRIGGLVAGVINAVVDWFTGKDIGDHIYTALFGNPSESANETVVAQAPEPLLRSPGTPPVTAEEPPEAPLQTSMAADAVLETDPLKNPQKSSAAEEALPLWLTLPRPIPEASEHAALSSYLRGRRPEEGESDSPRLHLKV